jgi:hypothetical protein
MTPYTDIEVTDKYIIREFKNNTIEFKKNNDTSFTGFTGYDEYYNGIFKTTIRSNTPIEKSDLQVIKNSFIRFK